MSPEEEKFIGVFDLHGKAIVLVKENVDEIKEEFKLISQWAEKNYPNCDWSKEITIYQGKEIRDGE